MYVAPLAEIISKICGNVLQDLWELGREKKSPRFVGIISKICGNVGEKKKSTRFVGEIFTRFSSLSPRKKNLQDLWDYFLGSKINKICGPHILLIFFLQEKWIYPQDSHVSCPRNSKISLEELYHRVLVSLISWPGQLLSLNPCRRLKILARMLFLGIFSFNSSNIAYIR